MIKGKTKIELLRDGKVIKAVEKSNTFQTDVVASLLRSLGDYNSTWPFSAGNYQMAKYTEMLGGILLFDKVVPLGSQYPPPGVNMTGNGCYRQPNAGPSEMGSFDISGSSITENEARMTWTWTESQGNGEIRSICLTSATAGLSGVGNASGIANAEKRTPDFGQNSNTIMVKSKNYTVPFNESIYAVDTIQPQAEEVVVYRRKASIDTLDIFNTQAGEDFTEEIHIPLMTEGGAPAKLRELPAARQAYPVSDHEYMCVWQQTGEGASLKPFNLLTIDIEARTAIVSSVNNRFGETLGYKTNQWFYFEERVWPISSDYIVCKGNERGGVYLVNVHTSEYVELSVGFDKKPINDTNSKKTNAISRIAPNLYLIRGVLVDGGDNLIIDTDTKSMKRCSMNYSYWSYNENYDCLVSVNEAIKSPMYLATINNLDDTLVKDGTMTMRITYTLTREA